MKVEVRIVAEVIVDIDTKQAGVGRRMTLEDVVNSAKHHAQLTVRTALDSDPIRLKPRREGSAETLSVEVTELHMIGSEARW